MNVSEMIANGYCLRTIEKAVRKQVIVAALKAEKYRMGKTAARLGLHRNVLIANMRNLRIPNFYQHRRGVK